MALTLTKIAETNSTITLGWTPPAGIEWYLFYAAGTRVANGSPLYESGSRKGQQRDEVKFSKPGEPYQVVGVTKVSGTFALDVGTYVASAPPPPDPDPPPPPPPGDLPFAEAQLRSGFQSVTIPVGTTSYTPPTSADYLIDLQGLERKRRLLVYGKAGQRIKIVDGYWNVTDTWTSGSAYSFGGIGFRKADTTGPEHFSLTDFLITGPRLADGIAIDTGDQTKITCQRGRIESAALITGQVSRWGLDGTPSEHCDAIQVQGPTGDLEFGLCTIYAQNVQTGNHPGKGFMLGMHWGSYNLALDKVNFRDFAGLPGVGAYIFQDSRNQTVTLSDVYALKQATTPAWSSGSSMFVSYQHNEQWYSTGTAPNRQANFRDSQKITGVVKEGLPPGGDYVTRAMLGL